MGAYSRGECLIKGRLFDNPVFRVGSYSKGALNPTQREFILGVVDSKIF